MLFERNNKGETPLTICQLNKNAKGVELLEQLQVRYDNTHQKAGDLLALLEEEELKESIEKIKRKEKKWRSKIAKIAEKNGLTFEEVEEDKKAAQMRKREADLEAELAAKRKEVEEEQRLLELAIAKKKAEEEYWAE